MVRRFFSASLISNFGDWMDFLAITVLFSYHWQLSPMVMALLPLAYAGPSILMGQFAGIVADKWNQRLILVSVDAIRALITFALLFIPDYSWMLLLLFLRSTADTLSSPAQQSALRRFIPSENLFQALTINGTIQQASKVLGPLLGASILAFASPFFCILLNACSFVLSAILLYTLPLRPESERSCENPKAGKERITVDAWLEGWRFIARHRQIQISFLFAMAAGMAIQCVDAQFAVLFREVAPTQPEMIGWVTSSIGIGSLIIMLYIKKQGTWPSHTMIYGGGTLLLALLFISLGIMKPGDPAWLPISGGVIGGLGNGLLLLGIQLVLQRETPEYLIGRMTGIIDSLRSTIFISAPLFGGILINQIGVSSAFLAIGITLLLLSVIGYILGKVIGKTEKAEQKKTYSTEVS